MAVPFLTQAYLVLVFRSLPACLASIEGTAYRRFTVSGQFFNRTRTEAATWPLIPAITDALIWQPGATLCAVNAAGRLNPPPFRCQSRHATAQALVMTVPFLTQQQGPAISPDYYKSFVLRNIKKITECCSRYVFVIDGIRRLGFSIGQHLIMRASVDGEIVTRQYTPVSPPSALGFFEVIIKVYPQGRMSKYIKTLKEGCSVDWRGPLGGLDYKPNVHKHMLLLAAGTGIAPMIQVLHHITSSDEDYTMVRLLFGIAKYREIYLKNELDELKAFWNVSILYCLSDLELHARSSPVPGKKKETHHIIKTCGSDLVVPGITDGHAAKGCVHSAFDETRRESVSLCISKSCTQVQGPAWQLSATWSFYVLQPLHQADCTAGTPCGTKTHLIHQAKKH
ncbi:NADH-cytochrome b5 reductase-like isoform X5 [Dermacentor albipictus]|uniref:NADH-cytochrome b5 reductase-like isoform X5 n=1 Tax=Dermacentor albipictus TaxID=60249 RepID=UPI0038FC9554